MKLLENGEEIRTVTDQAQLENSSLIKMGETHSNWELKQTFVATKTELKEISVMFGETVGNPEDDIIISLYDEDELIKAVTIPNQIIKDNINLDFPIGFDFSSVWLNDYTIRIRRTGDINPDNYFTIRGGVNEYLDGELKALNNSVWSTLNEHIYFITKVHPIIGDYPKIDPPESTISVNFTNPPPEFMQEANGIAFSGAANGVELDRVFIKANAMFIHPLEYVKVYVVREGGADQIIDAKFQEELNQKCFFSYVKAEDISPAIDELPFKMFVEVKYWNLQEIKRKGFPQSYDDDDPIYVFDLLLDKVGASLSLFRRKYRTDIPYNEYYKTYPIGYPWEDEQDYWFEKRINDEYATRPDRIDSNILTDIDDTNLLEFRCKSPDIHNVEITVFREYDDCCICQDTYETKIQFTDVDLQGITRLVEKYSWNGDIIYLMDEINFNSQLIEATYLNSPNSSLKLGTSFMYTEGTYQEYGLIKAEINQYLGVIPRIKDVVDYCLIWSTQNRTWNDYVWAGEEWDAGVFELHIPWKSVPKNFKLLEMDEVQQIIHRCKPFGTHAIPMYSVDELLRISFGTEAEGVNQINYLDPIDFNAYYGDMAINTMFGFNVEVSKIEVIGAEQQVNFGFTISREVAVMLDSGFAPLADGQFDNTYITSGVVKFGTSTQQVNVHAASVFDHDSGFGWTNQGAIVNIDGNSANAYASSVGNTKKIVGRCYPSIPSDAVVTGVAVRVNYANSSVTRSPYFTNKTHSVRLENNAMYTTKSASYPGGGSAYDAWFGWDGDLWGQSSNPSVWNQGVNVHYWATVDSGKNVWVDGMYLALWYRRKAGTYYSTTLIAPTVTPPDVGSWDTLTITDTKPSGTTILYDIYNHIPEQIQTLNNSSYAFGNSTYTEVGQTFIPTTSRISGVWVKAGNPAKIGNPTFVPKFIIRDDSTKQILIEKSISANLWTNDAEIFIPLNLGVTPGHKYMFSWWSNGVNANNYYQMKYYNQRVYRPADNCYLWVYEMGVGWRYINAGNSSAWFKVTRENVLLNNQGSGIINTASLPFESLTVKAKMSTNNPDIVPSVNSMRIKGKVIKT
ncbi:MAG: hypothetical protein Q8M92_03780 [Candidatus Subteraquimicrobiales bacterium]|nr:hypothetical protein [Candidatus Subteraquimicrobiales bacterium]